MGRLVGYMANRADRLADALYQERALFGARESKGTSGWGVGFYQGGEVLHKKRPRIEGQLPDWSSLAEDVRSDCVLLHARQPTVGDFRAENTHPFRFKSWLFAHRGTIERFEVLRPRLLESLPDFLRRSVRGATDSEVFFHLVLAFLHDAGALGAPELAPADALSALRSAVRVIDRMGAEVGAEQATLDCVLTNGQHMFGLARGMPMALVERRGLHTLRPGVSEPPGSPASLLRYVMLVSGDGEAPESAQLPPGTLVAIDHALSVTRHEL